MEVRKLSAQEYSAVFQTPYHVFNTAGFNQLNAKRSNITLSFLAFKAKKYKLGLIVADIDGQWRSPFSAPFGGFSYVKNDVGLSVLDEATDLLIQHGRQEGISSIQLTFPPLFYDFNFISKINNVLYRKHFQLLRSDLNYAIALAGDITAYEATLQYNAQKNLRIAQAKNFKLIHCKSEDEKLLAYDIIKQNRAARGFPLRMTFDIIQDTIQLIEADFFIVSLDGDNVAAAMIFHVSPGIVQVVYWGDLPEYAGNKTMNFLSHSIMDYYISTGIKMVDIGPSTEDSLPNYGLCDFKESIGCTIHPKYTYKFTY